MELPGKIRLSYTNEGDLAFNHHPLKFHSHGCEPKGAHVHTGKRLRQALLLLAPSAFLQPAPCLQYPALFQIRSGHGVFKGTGRVVRQSRLEIQLLSAYRCR